MFEAELEGDVSEEVRIPTCRAILEGCILGEVSATDGISCFSDIDIDA